MTAVDTAVEALIHREPTDDDRAGWLVEINEWIRDDPEFLPYLEDAAPVLYRQVVDGLHSLAVKAKSQEWRSPAEGVGARPEQLLPGTPGSFSDRTDWPILLVQGGRGSGKSRTGGEGTREMLYGRTWRERPRWALVGQTLESVRVDMVENTLLEILPPGSVDRWNRVSCELYLWVPGIDFRGRPTRLRAYVKGYSSDNPRKLRGANLHGGWFDELATWSDADRSPGAEGTTFSTAMLAMRAHDRHTWTPRVIATTTPRAVPLLRNPFPDDPENPGPGLYDDPSTVIAHMSTLDNLDNLSKPFIDRVVNKYKGTRLYDQEILGKLVDAHVGALWSPELIRDRTYPDMFADITAGGYQRIVIGVDPSVGAGRGDECGIVVSGLAHDGRAYVIEDGSLRGPASEWCAQIERLFIKHQADVVVAEVNNGGELVEETLGRYASWIPLRTFHAKRGKAPRAEPVSLLTDQDQVRFAGKFPILTKQLCTWEPDKQTGDSPDRLDAFVYSILWLFPKLVGIGDLVSTTRRKTRR